ncbi:HIG1 domain family member 1A, mitochondrial-like [Cimex lectularius]|uniref:HIG1 domain-containing protein n=1 Tax=Cimex lectularius TaxID=79782 RepID=A0A8I6RJT5_CIMLE|nr:HIG1 domain family member 1A, mitochondrial-like [Cimex lectularius]
MGSEYDDSHSSKLSRKIHENPFMPVGIAGLILACGFGAYQFKNKGKMSTSVYLMQLRVGAQGTIIGTLAIGVVYSLLKNHVFNKTD